MPTLSDPLSNRERLELRGASRSYKRGQETVKALDHVDLTLLPGEMALIIGPSGGGKSTFLHLLGGMDRPSEGEVRAGGVVISRLPSDVLAAFRRENVGFVFQSFHLIPGLTAAENVSLPLLLAGRPAGERRRRAVELLGSLGLGDRVDFLPGQLSGGQAQRVAIARALAADPPFILADEPTGDLDSASGDEVMEILRNLAKKDGRTVVVVTHNEGFVPLADRVYRIKDGRLSGDAPTAAPDEIGRAHV